MADLLVHPSIVVGPEDIITADILNLLATPVVDLALAEPVNDQNFLRNGNFYSSFWTTPAGMTCPVGVQTVNADYWYVYPTGAAVTTKRSTLVPDTNSLFSHEIDGATGVMTVGFGQNINGDLSATVRRICTFSGNIYNNTGLVLSPKLQIYSANAFNNFGTVTLQKAIDLQTAANAVWTFVSATVDLGPLTNIANGIVLEVLIPSGSLTAAGKSVNFSRIKFQIGEVATEFTDDVSLFVTTPSVDSTMLQDGCIARPSLFLPNVIPAGTYQAKSVHNGDLDDDSVDDRVLATGAAVANIGFTPINKAADTGVGPIRHLVDTVVGAVTPTTPAGVTVELSSANAANAGYFPSIGFRRSDTVMRTVGLQPDGQLLTVDQAGVQGRILDSVHQVDTGSYQDGSIIYAKLAQSLIDFICPCGMVMLMAGAIVPTGWLFCDGSPVSRVTYSTLFSRLGVYWGPGDGVTTFNLPDFRGRVPVGYCNTPASGITTRNLGTSGGNETHTLTIPELPAHRHTLNDPQHAHNVNDPQHTHSYADYYNSYPPGASSTGVNGAINAAGTSRTTAASPTGIAIYNSPTGITMDTTGSSSSHDIMQPFAVIFYVIKAT